jgi:hypothetical protein
VSKPSLEFESTFPTDEEMRQSVEEMLEVLFQEGGIDKLQEIIEEYPEIPSAPGLYALLAPDGILVKVLPQATPKAELKSMIQSDIAKRMLRPVFAQGIIDQMPYEKISAETFPMFLKLKKQYRIELLSCHSTEIPR